MTDIIRVLRIIEYTGPREPIEELISKSIHGEKDLSSYGSKLKGCKIRAATIGTYPEILEPARVPTDGTRDGDGTWKGGKWFPNIPAAGG